LGATSGRQYAATLATYEKGGPSSAILNRDEFTLAARFNVLPRHQ
jgi:hypothetical protein